VASKTCAIILGIVPAFPPDVLLIVPERSIRALLLAQLLEQGYEVKAADLWPVPRRYFQRQSKPRAVVLDLQGLPNPETTLDEIPALAPPAHVVVITALGSISIAELYRRGFQVVTRPAEIKQIAVAVERVLAFHE
jgi:DNA-binding NtrC family response regulator